MFTDYRPYYAEINLDNIRSNFKNIKNLAKGKKTIGIIKADAYGHGALEVSRILEEEGADYLAVAVVSEAVELRKNGCKLPILILGYTPPTLVEDIVKYDITQSVYTYELAEAISIEAAKQGKTAKVHIAIDTGMSRIGFQFNEETIDTIKAIYNLRGIYVEGIFTHFASADEEDKTFAKGQLEKYRRVVNRLSGEGINFEIKHIANSAGIMDIPEAYFDAVRPGIILYGYYPSNQVNIEKLELKPAMTLKAEIVHVKEIPEDTPISYGGRFITERKSKIATLPFGYADGFTRLLFGKAGVIINGRIAPIVGSICMDQCMVDVTDCGDVFVGDEVVVMGEKDGIINNADYYASLLGTINYEILCMVSRRVPRVYIENNKIIKVKNYL